MYNLIIGKRKSKLYCIPDWQISKPDKLLVRGEEILLPL